MGAWETASGRDTEGEKYYIDSAYNSAGIMIARITRTGADSEYSLEMPLIGCGLIFKDIDSARLAAAAIRQDVEKIVRGRWFVKRRLDRLYLKILGNR